MENINERIQSVSGLILLRMESILTQEEPDAKDIKAMTSSLRELSEIKAVDPEGGKNRLTVRFEGESERYST